MNWTLSNLKSFPSSMKKRRRVGRGDAAQGGTYGGRGSKGQNARSGGKHHGGHRGKKSPTFISQIPKNRGFKSIHDKLNVVNVGVLDMNFTSGEAIDPVKMLKKGLIAQIRPGVKILGKGTVKNKLNITADGFSKTAEDAIKKAGGTVTVIQKEKRKAKKSK